MLTAHKKTAKICQIIYKCVKLNRFERPEVVQCRKLAQWSIISLRIGGGGGFLDNDSLFHHFFERITYLT